MSVDTARKLNLEHLLEMASTYKGLNRKRLADALGRDPTKIFPSTANPKLDYLMKLADLLDWSVGDVAESIWVDPDQAEPEVPTAGYDAANEQARACHRAGDYAGMLRWSRAMDASAMTPEHRATAALRESGAWNGYGRFTRELEAIRRGLQESPITSDLRLLLQANLANAYYTLGYLLEARATSKDLVESLDEIAPTTRPSRAAQAFSLYVLGHASRCLMTQQPDRGPFFARSARAALSRSRDLYLALADEFKNDAWRGIARTCEGGLVEVEVESGAIEPAAGAATLMAGLDSVIDTSDGLAGDLLESHGWWCIFGCTIALHHLSGSDLQRAMAVFTNKGYEISDRLNNWALRERLFTMEFIRRQRLNELAGFPVEWTIDQEEVRVIVGTMGRFPAFRSTGWKILQAATIISGN